MEKEEKSNRDRETVNAAESFNYTNENNLDPRNNEFFVYHFEENKNKAGFEDNKKETGKEVNTDIDKATEIKTEDFSKVTKISKVATTTIQTVVATTTTTVVAVVAGGAAVAEMSYVAPNIHEFSAVETVGNAVSYTLLLGDDLEVIQNGEEQRSCNVVIELKLDSYDKVVETTKVDKYGSISGKFENLNYSCDYTITAYEYSFMDVAGWIPHELISAHFTTEDEVVTPVNNNDVGIRRLIDGYGDEYYCITLSYTDESNYYSDFELEIYNSDNELVYTPLTLEATTEEQRIRLSQTFDGQATYRVDVTCLSMDPKDLAQGRRANEGETEGRRITLVSKTVDFATIPEEKEEPITTATLEFTAEINSYGEVEYYAWFYYTDDIELESLFFAIYDPQEEQVGENYYLEYRQNARVQTPVELPFEDMETDWTYGIKVYKVVANEEDPTGASQAESELWFTTSLVLNDIVPTEAQYSAPTIEFSKNITADYQVEYFATIAVYDDPRGEFYAYYLEFDDGIADVPFQLSISGTPSDMPTAFKLDYDGELAHTYHIKGYRSFGRGNDAVTAEFINTDVDFDAIEATEEPITNNIFFYKTQRQNGEMLVDAMLTSPYEDDNYYSDFTLTLVWTPVGETQSDSREMRLTNAFRERQSLQGMDMNVEDWTYEMEVTVTCMSRNPEDTMTADAVEITFFQGTIDFNELPVTQEPYVEPVFVGETFTKAKTYYDNFNGLYLTINATDPCDFWYYYEFQLYEDANHGTAVGNPQTLDKNQTVRLDDSGDADNPYNEIVNSEDTYYYEIKTLAYNSANPEEPEEIMLVDDGSICFNDLTPTLASFAPYMIYTFTETGTDSSENTLYSLEGELVILDRERYSDYVLTWEDYSGSYSKTYQCGDFAYPCDFDGTDDINSVLYGTFTVTLTATDSYTYSTVTLYREDLYIARGIIEKA